MEQQKMEKRNLVLALLFSIAALFVVDALFPKSATQEPVSVDAPVAAEKTAAEQSQKAEKAPLPVGQIVDASAHIDIATPALSGSLRLKGARFDNLSLKKYRETMAEDSPIIRLLSPAGSEFPFFAEFGWISNEFGLALPTAETVWSAPDGELTPEKPLTLTWDNRNGLRFIRQISVDENYMFTITDRVENYADRAFTLFNYGLIGRTNVPPTARSAVMEGLIGYANGALKEYRYDKIAKEKQASFVTEGGWTGITDKYWMAVLAFDQDRKDVTVRFSENDTDDGPYYQTDYRLPPVTLNAGQAVQTTVRMFAGAKELKLIDAYEKDLGIKRFDLTVDFGWYYFITKPFLFLLSWFYSILGNMGLAILLFAFLLRLALYPLANKSFVSMARMKELQPKLEALREKCGEDKMKFNQEMMLLYQREKVNPAAGCLPMFIQIPVLFSLYKVLSISLELRQAPFYGWIHDLSAPDPSSVFTLCGLIDWPVPAILNIGVWPLLMGITMWLQQLLNPKPTEKAQAWMLTMMPWLMTFMLGQLASGLIIYWTWSNLLSMAQQYALRWTGKKNKHG